MNRLGKSLATFGHWLQWRSHRPSLHTNGMTFERWEHLYEKWLCQNPRWSVNK